MLRKVIKRVSYLGGQIVYNEIWVDQVYDVPGRVVRPGAKGVMCRIFYC
jgi:hypothetical protein